MKQVKLFFFRALLFVSCLFYCNAIIAYDFEMGGLCYNKLSVNQVEVTYKNYNDYYTGDYVIPEKVNYDGKDYLVVAIGKSAFRGCRELTSVSIPNSITSIGEEAFDGCDKLKSLVLSSSSSITTIGNEAFYNCESLESINLPDQISSIGNSAFWACSSLKTIKIPSSLSKIEDYVFLGCQSLVSIEFPDKITEIGKSSFGGCKDLKEIDFSNSLTKIGETAFEGCSSLTNILLPASLTSIGKKAFYSCSALKTVESKIKEPFETYAFTTWSGTPDDRILYVPSGTKEKYINCYGWGNFFKDVIEKVETYTLSITASGNGSASYNGTTIRGKTSSFTVNAGTSATITFSPDNGYRIKSVKVNNSTVSVSNNQYTISSINANTTISVEFEAIPVTTYTLSITASGNGSAFYGGTTVRGKTSSFTLNAGTSATISFTPDNGYRIKSVKVNNSTVTVSNNQYTISNINANTTVSVEFEAITYTLSITASGNGSASYSGTTVRGKTSSFTLNAGSSATITFSPDNGYRIKSVKVNNTTVSVSNNQYIISSINANTTVSVEFEAIPVTTYTLSITASGNGSASYSGTTIRSKTSTFTVNAGSSATITFTPDNGYRIKSVKVNNTTVSVSNNQYTISSINANTSVSVEFEAIPVTTYTLSITASGNGSASYGSTTIRSKTSSFTVNAGTSATITFSPDNGYRIKSVKVNNTTVSVSNNLYTISSINANTSVSVEFEAIPPTTYTLSITASGNGSASYSGTTVRGKTSSFTVNAGSSATIAFTPDNGYRIKSVKVNNTTVSVSNNQYTISNISANTTVNVEFEAVTYTLSITASGNGSASYGSTTIRSKTSTFTVNAGSSATITFTPDNGYRIKSVKVNNTTVSVSNNQYTISSINANTTVSVEFEAIPPTTYTLSITASGNGSASYSGTSIRGKTSSFTVNEGTSATITFSPDNGYRIKSVKVSSIDITSSVSNNQYTISNITQDISVEVEFEAIPPTTYTLSITATGNGSASYSGTTVRDKTSTFTVNDGTKIEISLNPDNGYRVKSIKENNEVVTSYILNGVYTISSLSRNTTIEVEFEAELKAFSADDVNYTVVSVDERTIRLAKGEYGMTLEVPANVSYQDVEWTVTGVDNGALANNPDLAAIIWHAEAAFTEQVSNPNFLLYVNQAQYAPTAIKNVVVNGSANSITLVDAASGNNFYCPQAFTAQKISYTHNYGMQTGIGEAKGWETIALPFDVQKVTHESKGEIVSFANWRSGDSKRPFWLMQLSSSGWIMTESIKANTPYIISMPNNPDYKSGFLLDGRVTFSAENVSVAKTENLSIANYSDRTFVPTFSGIEKSNDVFALNVVNDIERVTGGSTEGGAFERNLRPVHPFEAYMTSTSSTRSIGIDEGMATGIIELISALSDESVLRIHNLNGLLIKIEEGCSQEEVMKSLPAGVYIVNGKKMIIR